MNCMLLIYCQLQYSKHLLLLPLFHIVQNPEILRHAVSVFLFFTHDIFDISLKAFKVVFKFFNSLSSFFIYVVLLQLYLETLPSTLCSLLIFLLLMVLDLPHSLSRLCSKVLLQIDLLLVHLQSSAQYNLLEL